MLQSLLNKAGDLLDAPTVSAHCDIPCKIYDPFPAQIACLSVLRMVDLIQETGDKTPLSLADQAQMIRLVAEKEKQAELAKHEIRIIWGDWFKDAQLEAFPDTHTLVHQIMMAGSAAKQHVSREPAEKLLTLVNTFAENFWSAREVATYRAVCPYPPSMELVYPRLG